MKTRKLSPHMKQCLTAMQQYGALQGNLPPLQWHNSRKHVVSRWASGRTLEALARRNLVTYIMISRFGGGLTPLWRLTDQGRNIKV